MELTVTVASKYELENVDVEYIDKSVVINNLKINKVNIDNKIIVNYGLTFDFEKIVVLGNTLLLQILNLSQKSLIISIIKI